MSRILALQKLSANEFIDTLGDMTEASTCSYAGCGACSSYSDSGCKPSGYIAI